MGLLDDEAQVDARLGPFGGSDRCIVWAEHTIGSKIVLHATDKTPR
jgi:hypothetical protein